MKQKRDVSLEQGLALSCPNFARMLEGPLAGGFGCMLSMRQDLAGNQVGNPQRCKVYRGESCEVLQKLNPGEFTSKSSIVDQEPTQIRNDLRIVRRDRHHNEG
jgi:hypothetical protein